MAAQRIGGTFAPPLDSKKLTEYEKLATSAPASVKKAMRSLISLVKEHQKGAKSKKKGTPHPSGRANAFIVPLEEGHKQSLSDHLLDAKELNMYAEMFDELPTGTREGQPVKQKDAKGLEYLKPKMLLKDEDAKALRDACFHLLWFARELELGREPITSDQLEV